jgi:hypothetical protein
LTSHPPVTPNDLRGDPELAILAALDHTLKLAVYALVAVYPELTDSERPFWLLEGSATGHAASQLLACGEELELAIRGYRTAILRAREAEANEDLPF